jgi:hypothetical protein
MTRSTGHLTFSCAECGRTAPTDASELRQWRYGDLLLAGELDEVTAPLLLCPDCWRENRDRNYEEGAGD